MLHCVMPALVSMQDMPGQRFALQQVQLCAYMQLTELQAWMQALAGSQTGLNAMCQNAQLVEALFTILKSASSTDLRSACITLVANLLPAGPETAQAVPLLTCLAKVTTSCHAYCQQLGCRCKQRSLVPCFARHRRA